jgi:hypothetical protein
MMQILLGFAMGIILIGFQTSLIAVLPPWLSFYNLLIPYVIFLSLFRPTSETLLQIFWVGAIMDMLSVAPRLIYLIIFLCLFVLFRNIRTYFQLLDSYLFVILIAVGIAFEHLVFNMVFLMRGFPVEKPLFTVYVVLIHLLWAAVTGPLVLGIFMRIFSWMDQVQSRRCKALK